LVCRKKGKKSSGSKKVMIFKLSELPIFEEKDLTKRNLLYLNDIDWVIKSVFLSKIINNNVVRGRCYMLKNGYVLLKRYYRK